MKKSIVLTLIILAVLILDQSLKIYIKTNFAYNQEISLMGLSWAKLHFVENEGMAFGLSFGGLTGKIVLSVFRVFMVGFLIYILRSFIKAGEKMGLLISFALIIAGAIGNILDSAFYGLIFDKGLVYNAEVNRWMSYHGVAQMGGNKGYAPFMLGVVVDMLHFPMIDTRWPSWMPLVGGNTFQFFKPIFNIADSSIFVGVVIIIAFYRRLFKS